MTPRSTNTAGGGWKTSAWMAIPSTWASSPAPTSACLGSPRATAASSRLPAHGSPLPGKGPHHLPKAQTASTSTGCPLFTGESASGANCKTHPHSLPPPATPEHTHIHTDTHPQACTYTQTYRHIHRDRHTRIDTQTHTCTQTHRCTDTHTRRHTHVCMCRMSFSNQICISHPLSC